MNTIKSYSVTCTILIKDLTSNSICETSYNGTTAANKCIFGPLNYSYQMQIEEY